MFQRASASNTRTIPGAVATLGVSDRLDFIKRTYAHVAGAIFALTGLCYLWLGPMFESVTIPLLTALGSFGPRGAGLVSLLAFMLASWLAHKWAHSKTSRTTQYMGLGLYTVAMSFILLPMMVLAQMAMPEENLIGKAALITLIMFGGLTVIAFTVKRDFSLMGKILSACTLGAVGAIFVSFIFGFQLGSLFSGLMIALFGGWILHDTSNIIRHYPPSYHVGAALSLFSSIAMMFFYVLRMLLGQSR